MFIGYLCVGISLAIQLIASLLLFNLNTSPITLAAVTSIVTLVTFSLVSIKALPKILMIIRCHIFKVIALNLVSFLMIAPLYFCLINSLYPAIYALNFCSTLGFLSLLEKRNAWCIGLLSIVIIVVHHYHWDYLIIASLIGPLAAYATIKIASEIGIAYTISTSNVMVIRYLFSAIIFALLLPWLPAFFTPPLSWQFVFSMIIVVFFYNIVGIFFAQRGALSIGHKKASICYTIIPLLTFIAQDLFLNIENNYLMLLSVVLAILSLIASRYPIHWK